MPDLAYGSAAIEAARVAAATQARRIPALADLLDAAADDLGVDALASGGALVGALADLRAALEGELTAGGARMDEVDRALDATLRSMQGADADGAAGVRARDPRGERARQRRARFLLRAGRPGRPAVSRWRGGGTTSWVRWRPRRAPRRCSRSRTGWTGSTPRP